METKARFVKAMVAWLLLLAPIGAAANTTTLRLARGTWLLISVSVDGEGPFTFLLDTGTTRTLIDDELARSLGKQALGETTVRTPSGVSRAALVRVDRLRVGDRESRVIALVLDVDRIRSLPKDVVGILGLDFLSRYNFHIDYENRRLTLDDKGAERPVEGGTEVSARLDRGRLLLEASSARQDDHVWLALDTGAHRLVVYIDDTRKSSFVERDRYRWRKLASAGGVRIVTEARVKHMAFGSLEFHDVPATLLTSPVTTLEDGLLPGHLFRSLFVDPEQGLAILNGRAPGDSGERGSRSP